MRILLTLAAISALALSNPAVGIEQPKATATPLSAKQVFALAAPAVLRVESWRFFDKDPTATGTGFFISQDGLAVTNYHVIKDAQYVRFVDKTEAIFDIEGLKALSIRDDIVIVKLKARNVHSIQLGGSSTIQIGDSVYTIGNPAGLDHSLSNGLLSGRRELHPDQPLLQTTAPISSGSSGGPLLDESGRAIGVTSFFLADSQNLNFAVPTSTVQRLLDSSAQLKPIESILVPLEPPTNTPPGEPAVSKAPARQSLSAFQLERKRVEDERRQRNEPLRFRVRLTVSCREDSIRSLIESRFRSHLRGLTGVDVEDENPDYVIAVVALPVEGSRGDIVGTSGSIVTYSVLDMAKIGNTPAFISSCSIDQHIAFSWGSERISSGIEQYVASFDTEILEFSRQIESSMRSIYKKQKAESGK